MIWNHLCGHHEQVAMFRRAIGRGRAAHAYLFVGPGGIGKRLVAQGIAQSLFCRATSDEDLEACGVCPSCKQVQAGTHPDLLMVGCPPGKRELPISLIAGEDERRGREGLCYELAMRPMSASRRIAIIDDAQTMNEASANALLKTLEEPPGGSMLFLISPSTDALLPTIRSRCQPILFSPLTESDITELLLNLELVPDRTAAEEVAALSEGSLETASQLLDPALRRLRKVVISALDVPSPNWVTMIEQVQPALEELGGDASEKRQNATWLIRFAIQFFRDRLTGSDELPLQMQDRLASALECCFDAEQNLARSMPVPLVMETLFDRITRSLRAA